MDANEPQSILPVKPAVLAYLIKFNARLRDASSPQSRLQLIELYQELYDFAQAWYYLKSEECAAQVRLSAGLLHEKVIAALGAAGRDILPPHVEAARDYPAGNAKAVAAFAAAKINAAEAVHTMDAPVGRDILIPSGTVSPPTSGSNVVTSPPGSQFMPVVVGPSGHQLSTATPLASPALVTAFVPRPAEPDAMKKPKRGKAVAVTPSKPLSQWGSPEDIAAGTPPPGPPPQPEVGAIYRTPEDPPLTLPEIDIGPKKGWQCSAPACKKFFHFDLAKCPYCGNVARTLIEGAQNLPGVLTRFETETQCGRCGARRLQTFWGCPECGTDDNQRDIEVPRTLPEPSPLPPPLTSGVKDHRSAPTWYPSVHFGHKGWDAEYHEKHSWLCKNCQGRYAVKFADCPLCGAPNASAKLAVKLAPPQDLVPHLHIKEVTLDSPDEEYPFLNELVARADAISPLLVWTVGQFVCDNQHALDRSPGQPFPKDLANAPTKPCNGEELIVRIPGVNLSKVTPETELEGEYQCLSCGHKDKLVLIWAEWKQLREVEPIAWGYMWRVTEPVIYLDSHKRDDLIPKRTFSLDTIWSEVAQTAPQASIEQPKPSVPNEVADNSATRSSPVENAILADIGSTAGTTPIAPFKAETGVQEPKKSRGRPKKGSQEPSAAHQELLGTLQGILDPQTPSTSTGAAPALPALPTGPAPVVVPPGVPPIVAPKPRSLGGSLPNGVGFPAQAQAQAQTNQTVGIPVQTQAQVQAPVGAQNPEVEKAVQEVLTFEPPPLDIPELSKELQVLMQDWPLEKLVKEYETLTGQKFIPNQTASNAMTAAVISRLVGAVAPV